MTTTATAPATTSVAPPTLSVKGLWKVFGPRADQIIGTPDADLSRAEREARLGGQIVAADFHLRQITMLEVMIDVAAAELGRDAHDLLAGLRRGGTGVLQIASTPFSDHLDLVRRDWWAREGDPERPPHPDPRFIEQRRSAEGDYAVNVDQSVYGGCSTPARGYSQEEWAQLDMNQQLAARERQFAEDAEAQIIWEQQARAEFEERRRSS